MSKINELLKKLKALAEKGEGGEATNAKKMLADLMLKHNISAEEIEQDDRGVRAFAVKKEQGQFFCQVASSVLGRCEVYRVKKYKNRLAVECNAAEWVEINQKFEFYWRKYQADLDIFYMAFIQRNGLYRKGPAVERELTKEEKAAMDLAEKLNRHDFLKQITSPKIKEA